VHECDGRHLALVHRRLAIIDLDARSDQPFRFDRCTLVFNGEVYNYLEVRGELLSLGHTFRTDGDTEVLAHALREWGEGALDKLEGMWAFAWYDERDGTLLLCRDRFGEKPLYLWRRDEGLYFASEVKGLAALAGEWPAVNEDHLVRYLVNGYKALYKVPETFFDGVEELPHATCLRLSASSSDGMSRRYWTPRVAVDEGLSYADAVTRTRQAVVEAVRLRLRADVPLAFCMSGGVDSNGLIAIGRRVLGYDVHGFTIVNTDARYEEQGLVDQAVRELNIRHTPVRLEQRGFLDSLRALVRAHDAPVYTVSYYVHWQLMRAIAADGYKVTISGTGADELFTGYYDHHNLYLREVANEPALYEKSLAAWRQHVAGIVRNPFLRDPECFLRDPSFRGHIYLNSELFESWLHARWSEPFTEADYGSSLLRTRMLNELFAESVPVILHEDDLNAMAFSMENRSPFLDRRLFEMAYSIPSRHLVQDGRAKAVLRDALRGIVPDPILDSRRKVGFNAPILDLLDVNDPDVRAFLLDNGPVYDLVRKDRVEDLLKQTALPNSLSKFLFYFINVKMFTEERRTVRAREGTVA
jgi:asparagine synthase (glutamine-hydrolysing)